MGSAKTKGRLSEPPASSKGSEASKGTHWGALSPAARFATLLATVGGFHLAGAAMTVRMPKLATACHGIGTIALGAGIYLAGQIFNLEAHWPAGLMLWGLGACLGFALLRDWVQGLLAGILVPLWLLGELAEAPVALGWSAQKSNVACLLLLPLALALAFSNSGYGFTWGAGGGDRQILGWALALAAWARGRAAWANALAALWAFLLVALAMVDWHLYAWCALGAAALVGWGLLEARRERVNLGVAAFALTLLAFYFSSVLDRLGRSAGLVGLGLLFLLGGWQLERLRRKLNAVIEKRDNL